MTTAPSTQDRPVAAGPAGPTADPADPGFVDLTFVDLVCGDDQLLAAEFEAIIAASWDGPGSPGAVLARTDPGRPGSPGRGRGVADPPAPAVEVVPTGSRSGRQRSPPPGRAGGRET